VLKFTGGQGADVILDIMGGPYLAGNLDALASWGRLEIIATRGGSRGEIDLGLMMQKRISMAAATLRSRTDAEKAEVVAATREHIWPLVNAGKVVPVIHAVLPMADAAQAHRLIDDGTHIGKILLAN
jgi:NADPH:quinone reductase-like Zn-dependent oxidoreductase